MIRLTIATFFILLSIILFSPKRAIIRFLETGSLSKNEEVECMWLAMGMIILFVGVSLFKHIS